MRWKNLHKRASRKLRPRVFPAKHDKGLSEIERSRLLLAEVGLNVETPLGMTNFDRLNKARQIGDVPQLGKDLMTLARTNERNSYRLRWTGTNIPRDASVELQGRVHPIAMTQLGMVVAQDGTDLGFYTRTAEAEGPGFNEYEMVISTRGKVIAGPNQTVELIRTVPLAQI